jgi:hypothetical protein
MANNVFGDPINDLALTQLERARQALDTQTAGGKDNNARTFVRNLKAQYGNGVSALCIFYNATGNTLTFVDSKDWYGQIWTSPYPQRIQNGQWGAFLHTKRPVVATGSMAAAVFRGTDGNGNSCDYMMSWMHPWGAISNSVSACLSLFFWINYNQGTCICQIQNS